MTGRGRPSYRAHPHGCWPTASQRLLLRACLGEGDAGRAAWREWRAAGDLDRIDPGSFRLLGLLYRNLARLGVADDPWLPRLGGIHRYFWARHQLVLRHKPALLGALRARGIATLVLKGAALSLAVYRDAGVRPMDDFDVLVPRDRAHDAMAALQAAGLRPLVARPERLPGVLNGCDFEEAPGQPVDLHWQLLARDARPGTDDEFWAASRPLAVGAETSRMLAPADQLLHTAEHGLRFNPVPPLRWLADAATVIRSAGADLDWDRLLRQSSSRGLVLPVRETLAYLRDELDVAVPDEVARDLARARVTWPDRIEHALWQRPLPPDAPWWRHLPPRLAVYARARPGAGRRDRPGLLRFVEVASGSDRPLLPRAGDWIRRELPRALARRWRPRPEAPGSIARIPDTALRGFHRPERWEGRPFRWSRPEAQVRCALPRDAYTVRLDLGGLRGWHQDLERGLRAWFNDEPIPHETIHARGNTLAFPVAPEWFTPAAQQLLRLACPPYPAPPDPRPLGLPVFAIHFEPARRADARPGPARAAAGPGLTARQQAGPPAAP